MKKALLKNFQLSFLRRDPYGFWLTSLSCDESHSFSWAMERRIPLTPCLGSLQDCNIRPRFCHIIPEDTPFRRPPEHHQLPSALSPIDASASENGGPMGPVILCTNLCKLPQSQRAHDLTSHTLTYVLTRVLDSDQRNSNLWGHTRKMSRTANSDVSAVAISSASHPFHCWPPVSAPDKSLLLIAAPMD